MNCLDFDELSRVATIIQSLRDKNGSGLPDVASQSFKRWGGVSPFLSEQLRDELVQGRAPDFHGMDLIRVLFERIGDLQCVQAGDKLFGSGPGYRILAPGSDI